VKGVTSMAMATLYIDDYQYVATVWSSTWIHL
jgi:hypothetical protein